MILMRWSAEAIGRASKTVLSDPRLAPVHARWTGDVWPTPDPRLRVLQEFPDQFRAVTIALNDLA